MHPSAYTPAAPSPLVRIDHPVAAASRVEWYAKRDDHYALTPRDPYQGNKVRKMAGFLADFDPGRDRKIITFGGAYSNHLAATASVGSALGIPAAGIVRGEEVRNPVLDFCRKKGMFLHFVDRSQYRRKGEPAEIARYLEVLGPGRILPEGGSGPWNRPGVAALLREIEGQLPAGSAPFVQLAAGTGGTAAAIIAALNSPFGPAWLPTGQDGQVERHHVERGRGANWTCEVYPVLKGGWMRREIEAQLPSGPANRWSVVDGYHWGGYAKRPPELLAFCGDFTARTGVPLEPVYSGKLFYGVLDRMRLGRYPPGSRVVTYHGGGIF